ncbi:MAG: amidohydrolase family protein [Deltaproteobacteria bacterium]|nr:amidohydrolase family protein [Deltaproteobacteria bacterium]
MQRLHRRSLKLVLLTLPLVVVAGCGDDSESDADAEVHDDADATGDEGLDVEADGDEDGGLDVEADGDEDGGDGGDVEPPDGHPREPTITECPEPLPPPPDEGVCEWEAGTGDGLLIVGTVLTPGEVLRGGEVWIDGAGDIACVGCDCAADADAPRLHCRHGVISPGLINTHDHITYMNNVPYTLTEERFEHRHHWRRGLQGHSELDYNSGASRREMLWGELRMVLGGATSLNGSGSTSGFLRNLDRADQEGLGVPRVHYSTFPLGDSDGTLLTSGCGYPSITTAGSIADSNAYTPHVSEGIDRTARNEFLCMNEGSTDLVQDQSAFMHGVGLLPTEIAEMALDGTDLIWSPRTNITLYGDTARVTEYHALGVPIGLGTDWIISGSMNMLRELRCADFFNELFLRRDDGYPYFTSEELWLMATRGAARTLGVDDVLGTLEPGQAADIAIFDGSVHVDHRAVIDAEPQDVVLVLRRGTAADPHRLLPLFGDADVVAALPGGDACDPLDVCGTPKAVCVSRETDGAETLASLAAANADQYPLFFCGPPEGEPSCLPWRNAAAPFPSPEVNGSNRYLGEPIAGDEDGDGIPDDEDNCPLIFNPIRPMDGGVQADFDGDGVGDACDPCPLHPAVTTCALPPREDLDADGVHDATDNCPRLRNPGQEDRDGDLLGDDCDLCPDDYNPAGAPCPATIYEVKDPAGRYTVGDAVAIHGSIVTAVGSNGFFMQVDPADAAYTGPEYSGIFVFTSSAPTVAVGDRVDVTSAQLSEYNCQLQLGWATVSVVAHGVSLPEPAPLTTAEVRTGGTRADAYEAVLIEVTDVAVTDTDPEPCLRDSGENEFEVSDTTGADALRVDDWLYAIAPLPAAGERFAAIRGVLAVRNCCSKLLPRTVGDVVFGSAGLAGLAPPLSYARQGTTGNTFPEPLTVHLTRIASTDLTIALSSSDAGLTVADVVVPAGSLSAPVPVSAFTASATPYTITATLGADVRTAEVRVVGPTEVPRLVELRPAAASLSTGGSLDLTVVLDLPAPAGGTVVDLSVTGGGTVPASVTVPADALEATFAYTAGAAASTDVVTATLGTDVRTSLLDVFEGPTPGLVINELDYDTVGTDNAEFVELYNATSTTATLDGLTLIVVNGAATAMSEVRRFDLSGTLAPHAFFLLAGSAVTVPSGVSSVALPNDAIQNGAPDGIALFDTVTGTLVDALSYEGEMIAVTFTGVPGTFNLVEGTAATAQDNNSSPASLIRLPDGADSNNALDDWRVTTTPTPGLPNVP